MLEIRINFWNFFLIMTNYILSFFISFKNTYLFILKTNSHSVNLFSFAKIKNLDRKDKISNLKFHFYRVKRMNFKGKCSRDLIYYKHNIFEDTAYFFIHKTEYWKLFSVENFWENSGVGKILFSQLFQILRNAKMFF